MRHFLFVVPPLAVLAGIGVACVACRLLKPKATLSDLQRWPLWRRFSSGMPRSWCGCIPTNISSTIPSSAASKAPSRRYVMDYWVNIMPAAVNDLETYLDQADTPRQSASPATLHRCGLWGTGLVRERGRPALAIHPRLEPRRLFHRAHAYELRPRASRQDRKCDRAGRRAHRGGEGSAGHKPASAVGTGRDRARSFH